VALTRYFVGPLVDGLGRPTGVLVLGSIADGKMPVCSIPTTVRSGSVSSMRWLTLRIQRLSLWLP
jgi:hypothetical protein